MSSNENLICQVCGQDHHNRNIVKWCDRSDLEIIAEILIAKNKIMRDALEFYAGEDAWYLQKDINTGSEIRRIAILDDTESFGYQHDEYSKNILQVFAGKRARQALKQAGEA